MEREDSVREQEYRQTFVLGFGGIVTKVLDGDVAYDEDKILRRGQDGLWTVWKVVLPAFGVGDRIRAVGTSGEGSIVRAIDDDAGCYVFDHGVHASYVDGEYEQVPYDPQAGDIVHRRGQEKPLFRVSESDGGTPFEFFVTQIMDCGAAAGAEITRHALQQDYVLVERRTPLAQSLEEAFGALRSAVAAATHECGEEPEEVHPFYPICEGDVFYCTNDCHMVGADGRECGTAYTKGNTYVSELDGCITDNQGRKDHAWTPDGHGMLAGNFLRKVRHARRLITEGTWVVRGTQVACVEQIIDGRLITVSASLFGPIRSTCEPSEVHRWTLADARRGDFLTYEWKGGQIVFITRGWDDGTVCMSFAGYNTRTEEFWRDEWCCLAVKDLLRPATEQEKLLLQQQIEVNGMHWNLDRLVLEEKPPTDGARLMPTSDVQQLQERLDRLEESVEWLKRRVDETAIRNMPLGGNSCI